MSKRVTVHDLKCWPEPYAAIARGEKTHEIRRNDRGYQVGDTLLLHEWIPYGAGTARAGTYTGAASRVIVTHVTPGGQWGLPADLCVMSIRLVGERHD